MDIKAVNAAFFILTEKWMKTLNPTLKHAAEYLYYTYLSQPVTTEPIQTEIFVSNVKEEHICDRPIDVPPPRLDLFESELSIPRGFDHADQHHGRKRTKFR